MPQIPVTHYKDDPAYADTENLVNEELNKEAAEKKESAEVKQDDAKVELKVLPVKKSEKKTTNASNIVNAFRQKMATSSMPVELPSIGKTVDFKEISASEQKDLSKIAMENDSRADIMYCAMVGLINRLALEKGFDIRNYTEFERIAIILNLQQMNKINPEIKYACVKCGKDNSYRLDTQKMLKEFSKAYRPDQEVEVEAGNRKFTFTIGWSSVKNIEDFFKNYYKKYDGSSKSAKDTINQLSQVEYITMFVKKVAVAEISNPDDSMVANLEELTYPERVQIIDCLPQVILFDDDTGVIAKIIEKFVNPMNDCFKYRDCEYCGAEQTGAMANITDFMGY